MTGTHDLTALVTSAWEAVDDPTTARGDLSLDAIGDVLETGRLPRDEAERAAERLVALALSAKDDPVRESALHALCLSTGQYRLPYRTLAPLAEHGDAFAPVLLPYVLAAVSSTHDRQALPLVQRYLRHPGPEVRAEAAEALHELRLGTACP
ncbi:MULTISPECIES: HEAT repeat domain-containing protein [Streptomyces]|uniref:hypothetical protein n=1 Tax=Streptomyces TaxID=1883 RepID=UPI0039817FE8|nr:hypothetical protein OH717_23440 [Streptomyces albidoflavus]